jgi:hypothetical protein
VYCIVKGDKFLEAENRVELILALGCRLDYENRTATLPDGSAFTISYEKNGDDVWFARSASSDILRILTLNGWRLYVAHRS